jgi:DNA-binding CsgD family transcriptional regulator
MKQLHDFPYFGADPKTDDQSSNSAVISTPFYGAILQNIIEDLLHGVLILTEHQEVVYANDFARQSLIRFDTEKSTESLIPQEIWLVCQSLIQSRDLFPGQHWLIRAEVVINHLITFDLQVQWLNVKLITKPYLLLVMKDLHQSARNLALEEAQKYDLTTREQEIWLLYRANHTYKQIASVLNITLNTVKKHMSSIYTKQRAFCANVELETVIG